MAAPVYDDASKYVTQGQTSAPQYDDASKYEKAAPVTKPSAPQPKPSVMPEYDALGTPTNAVLPKGILDFARNIYHTPVGGLATLAGQSIFNTIGSIVPGNPQLQPPGHMMYTPQRPPAVKQQVLTNLYGPETPAQQEYYKTPRLKPEGEVAQFVGSGIGFSMLSRAPLIGPALNFAGSPLATVVRQVGGKVLGPKLIPMFENIAKNMGVAGVYTTMQVVANNYDSLKNMALKDPLAAAKWLAARVGSAAVQFGAFGAITHGIGAKPRLTNPAEVQLAGAAPKFEDFSGVIDHLRNGVYEKRVAQILVSPVLQPGHEALRGTQRVIDSNHPPQLLDATGRPFGQPVKTGTLVGPNGIPVAPPEVPILHQAITAEAARREPALKTVFGPAPVQEQPVTPAAPAGLAPSRREAENQRRAGEIAQVVTDADPQVTGKSIFARTSRNTRAGGYNPQILGTDATHVQLTTGRRISHDFLLDIHDENGKVLWKAPLAQQVGKEGGYVRIGKGGDKSDPNYGKIPNVSHEDMEQRSVYIPPRDNRPGRTLGGEPVNARYVIMNDGKTYFGEPNRMHEEILKDNGLQRSDVMEQGVIMNNRVTPAQGQSTPSVRNAVAQAWLAHVHEDEGGFVKLPPAISPLKLDMHVASLMAQAGGKITRGEIAEKLLSQFPQAEPNIEPIIDAGLKTYEKMMSATLGRIPSFNRVAELFARGDTGAPWYDTLRQDLEKYVGPQMTDSMLRALAITSQAQGVAGNVTKAVRLLTQWKSGEKLTGLINAEVAQRGMDGGPMPGRKTQNFYKAMTGDPNAYVHDRWMHRAMGFSSASVTDAQYDFAERYMADMAKYLSTVTGRPISVRYLQESIWEGIKMEMEPGEFRGQDFATILGKRPDLARKIRATTGNILGMDSPQAIEQTIRGGKYAILSADQPGRPVMIDKRQTALGLPAHDLLLKDLHKLGYTDEDIVPLRGRYMDRDTGRIADGESSVLVRGMGDNHALQLGKKYGQSTVITEKGLIDTDSKLMNPRTDAPVLFGQEAFLQPSWSVVQRPDGTEIPFAIQFDFAHDPVMHPAFTPAGKMANTLIEGAKKAAQEGGFLKIGQQVPAQPEPSQPRLSAMMWVPDGGGFRYVDINKPGTPIMNPHRELGEAMTRDAMGAGVNTLQQAAKIVRGTAGGGGPTVRGNVPKDLQYVGPMSLRALADATGTTTYDIGVLQHGNLTQQNVEAALRLLSGSAQDMRRLAVDYLKNPTEKADATFKEGLRRHGTLQMNMSGWGQPDATRFTEFRRTLQTGEVRGDAPGSQAFVVPDVRALASDLVRSGNPVKVLGDYMRPSRMDAAIEVRNSGLLSGPGTLIKKSASDIMMLNLIPLERTVTGFNDWLLSKRSGQRTAYAMEGPWTFVGYANALQDASRNFLYALANDMRHSSADVFNAFETGTALQPPAAQGVTGVASRLMSRGITAMTEFMRELHRRGALYSLAYRDAIMSKATDVPEHVRQFTMNPPKWAQEYATEQGKIGTFTDKSAPFFRNIEQMRNQSGAAGRFFLPFLHVMGNIAKQAFDRSPLAAPGAARELGNFLKDPETARMSQTGVAEKLARIQVGAAIAGSMMLYALGGNITGRGPDNPTTKDMMMQQGWRPNSFRVGNVYMPDHMLGPVMPFAMEIGSAVERFGEYRTDHDKFALAVRLSTDFGKNMGDLQFVTALATMYQQMTQGGLSAARAVGSTIGSFVPAIIADTARAGDVQRDPTVAGDPGKTVMNEVKQQIPGLRKELPPRIDRFGNPIPQSDLGVIGGYLPPMSVAKPNPAAAEIEHLSRLGKLDPVTGERTGQGGVGLTIAPLPRTSTIGHRSYTWTPQQYANMEKERGKMLEATLSRYMTTDLWPQMSDARKIALIQRIERAVTTNVIRRAAGGGLK